jgi:hypothetical protein
MRERRCVSVFLLFVLASTEPARGQGSVWGAPAVTVTHDAGALRLQYAPLRNQGAVFAHRSVEATHDDWDFIQRYAATVTGARARRHVFATAEEYQWRGNSHQARPLRLRVTATRGSDSDHWSPMLCFAWATA